MTNVWIKAAPQTSHSNFNIIVLPSPKIKFYLGSY